MVHKVLLARRVPLARKARPAPLGRLDLLALRDHPVLRA